ISRWIVARRESTRGWTRCQSVSISARWRSRTARTESCCVADRPSSLARCATIARVSRRRGSRRGSALQPRAPQPRAAPATKTAARNATAHVLGWFTDYGSSTAASTTLGSGARDEVTRPRADGRAAEAKLTHPVALEVGDGLVAVPEPLAEGPRMLREADEQEAPVLPDRDRVQRVVVAFELLVLVDIRRRQQVPVEVVRPRVVRAL